MHNDDSHISTTVQRQKEGGRRVLEPTPFQSCIQRSMVYCKQNKDKNNPCMQIRWQTPRVKPNVEILHTKTLSASKSSINIFRMHEEVGLWRRACISTCERLA